MSVLKAFTFSLVVVAILAILATGNGTLQMLVMVTTTLMVIIAMAKNEKAPIMKNDGFEYKAFLKDYVTIKWSEIVSIAFEYSDHYEADSYWRFKMLNGKDIRVTTREADKKILLPAMAINLEGFCCNYSALVEEARQESRENKNNYVVIHCWGAMHNMAFERDAPLNFTLP